MRLENSPPLAALAARLRSRLERAGRLVQAQGPVIRVLLACVVIAIVVALGYLAAPDSSAAAWLRDGARFSADDLAKITRALEAKHLSFRVDDHRVEVEGEHLTEATDLLAKLDVGPLPLKPAIESSPWETPWDRETRLVESRERSLAAMIRNIEGVVSASVWINRPKGRTGLRPTRQATAFVYLETDTNRDLGLKTVQDIQNLVVGFEPDLKPNAVTIFDQKGRHYLDAGNPTVGDLMKTRVREEELSRQLLEQLDWVKGVRVAVQVVPAPAPAPVPVVAPVPSPPVPEARVMVNQPATLDSDPEPPPAPAPPPASEGERARIWVKVPRSFYYQKALPNRDPSFDDLQPLVGRTEGLIRKAVEHVLPPGAASDLSIDTIPDEAPLLATPLPPLRAAPAPESWRVSVWGVAAGAGGALLAPLLVLGLRRLLVRRPGPRTVAAERGPSIRDAPDDSGLATSDRVRELIRRNPEAAASVLHRWIGQGGHPA